MNKEKGIEILKLRIEDYKSQLPLLCDEDYYNCCNMIEQLELQLKELQKDDKVLGGSDDKS